VFGARIALLDDGRHHILTFDIDAAKGRSAFASGQSAPGVDLIEGPLMAQGSSSEK
jgi:hypothetical protein